MIKSFNAFSISESSHSDFLMHYRDEIKLALKQLKTMSAVDEETMDDATYGKLEKALAPYDKNVQQQIERWLSQPNSVDAEALSRFALSNQDRYGTEPQMVLEAIERYYNICNVKFGLEKEEEE